MKTFAIITSLVIASQLIGCSPKAKQSETEPAAPEAAQKIENPTPQGDDATEKPLPRQHSSLSAPPVSSWIPPVQLAPLGPAQSVYCISPYLDECYEVQCPVEARRTGQEVPVYHITQDGKRGPRAAATKLLGDMGKDNGFTQVTIGDNGSATVRLYQTAFVDGRVDLIGVEYSGLVIFWRAQNRESVTYSLNRRESAADIQAAGVNLDRMLAKFPDIRTRLTSTLALRIGQPRGNADQHTYDLVGAAVHLGERAGIIQGKQTQYELVAHITKAGDPLVNSGNETGVVGVNEGGQVVTFLTRGEAIVTEEGSDGRRVMRKYTYDDRHNLRARNP